MDPQKAPESASTDTVRTPRYRRDDNLAAVTTLDAWQLWATVSRGLAPTTIGKYRSYLTDLQSFVYPSPLIGLASEQVRDWVEGKGGSSASVAGRVAAARSYFSWLVRTEQRDDDPSSRLDRPRVHKGIPKPISDVPLVLSGLSVEFQAVATFLVETGMRLSEAWGLNVSPPCPDELIVKGKGSKERWLPIPEEARRALDSLGGKMPGSPRTFQKACQRLGVTPHKFRHTYASELFAAGVDVLVIQKLLGHSSVATTQIYTLVDRDRLRQDVAKRKRR